MALDRRRAILTLRQNFKYNLLHYVASQLEGDEYDEEKPYPLQLLQSFKIKDNKLHIHKTLRINYTTYDMQRGSDYLKPHSDSADIMVLSSDPDEEQRNISPFWYARLIGIYSVEVVPRSSPDDLRRIYFTHVRWYGQESGFAFGDNAMQQERVGFICSTDNTQQLGFLDPSLIIRRVHIIPAFDLGRTDNILRGSPLSRPNQAVGDEYDYEAYYVNRLV